jgi:hypothetical protein
LVVDQRGALSGLPGERLGPAHEVVLRPLRAEAGLAGDDLSDSTEIFGARRELKPGMSVLECGGSPPLWVDGACSVRV